MLEHPVRVEVNISDTTPVKNSYTLYRIELRIIRGNGQEQRFTVSRRFSEFVSLKKQLEQEFNAELPYELPPRHYGFWNKSSHSCDPQVIQERKSKLSTFLLDLLNDSFDTRWKKSPFLCHFLQLPGNWDTQDVLPSHTRQSVTHTSDEDACDVQRWLEIMRDCKSQLEEATRSGASSKLPLQIRFKTQSLEKGLRKIQESQLIGEGEIQRRWNLLTTLKDDLNNISRGPHIATSADNQEAMRDELFSSAYKQPHRPAAGRRKIGETEDSIDLNNQELLQLHKDTMKDQDVELEQLRQIIQRQKNISLEMNQELATQNELLDMFDDDVNSTSNKLRMANRNAKRFSNGQS